MGNQHPKPGEVKEVHAIWDAPFRRVFLDAFAQCGNVHAAMRAVAPPGHSGNASYVFDLIKRDPQFKAAFDEARQQAAGRLVETLNRLAAEGNLEPVYQKGEKVGEVRKYNSKMMELALRSRTLFPDRDYAASSVVDSTVHHDRDNALVLQAVEVMSLTPALRADLARVLTAISQRRAETDGVYNRVAEDLVEIEDQTEPWEAL